MATKVKKTLYPVVKWVGGKRQLLDDIECRLPDDFYSEHTPYYEPFVGGGAVLFQFHPYNVVINDTNEELINLYRLIRDEPEGLIEDLKKHQNNPDYFYIIRKLDRDNKAYAGLTDIERASRMVYLNKTCYNGLFRVNRKGQYNAPFGRNKKPNIVNEKKIKAISNYFNNNNIKIMNCDFEESLEGIKSGTFVYFDPPYDPVSLSANFTGYTTGGFGRNEQIRLKEVCDRLDSMGVKFLLSNSATDFIRELYSGYSIEIIPAKRAVNSNAVKRGTVEEVLVWNY